MDFEALLRKNQARLGMPRGIQPWNDKWPELPLEENVRQALDAQVRAQKEFFHLPTPEVFLWVVCDAAPDFERFFSHYKKVLPAKTHVVLLADGLFPPSEEVIASFKSTWNTLILRVPKESNQYHGFVQFKYFRELYPRRLGLNTWNLFVDIDELLPLPIEYPDFTSFLKLLDSKGMTQLSSYMVDIWELRSQGASNLYFDSFQGPGNLSQYLDFEARAMRDYDFWVLTEEERRACLSMGSRNPESMFIGTSGLRVMWHHDLRTSLAEDRRTQLEGASKLVLAKPNEDFSYSVSSHEPHYAYQNVNDFLVRYPLLHFKFIKSTYLAVIRSALIRKQQAAEGNEDVWNVRGNYYERLDEIVRTASEKGIGPYRIFGEHDDDKPLEVFADRLRPFSALVDESYHFPLYNNPYLTKNGVESMYPVLHLDPLF